MAGKILITGAAGFIGSHLVELLLSEKEKVSRLRLLIRDTDTLDNLPSKNFDIVRGDIADKEFVKKAMEGVEIVYHLAAKIDFDGKWGEYKETNVDGTANLLSACEKGKVKKFINFSSIGVFGLPAGVGDILGWDEDHPKTYSNLYGRSKWEAEKLVMKAHEKKELSYVTIRPASVYGPREKGPTYELYKAIKNNRFFPIGNGENKMHYVYVSDLVKAARQAEKGKVKAGEYIIAGAKPTKFKDVYRHISQSIAKKPSNLYIPKGVAMTAAYGFLFLEKITGKKMPLFPSRVRTMTTNYYYNIDKARKEIGYDPKISFEKGAKITGRWYLENGWL